MINPQVYFPYNPLWLDSNHPFQTQLSEHPNSHGSRPWGKFLAFIATSLGFVDVPSHLIWYLCVDPSPFHDNIYIYAMPFHSR